MASSSDGTPVTPCECKLAGFCDRHNVRKNHVLHKLCQTKQSYFDAWETKTIGNVDPDKRPSRHDRGLGDTVARIAKRLGFKMCGGCNGRRKLLNRLIPYRKQRQ